MKRILLVTDVFAPEIGGPATFIDQLSFALTQKGYEVKIICASIVKSDPKDSERPFKVVRIPKANRLVFAISIRAALVLGILTSDTVLVNTLEYPTYQVARLLRKKIAIKIVGDTAWETARNLGITADSIDVFQKKMTSHGLIMQIQNRRNMYLGFSKLIITPSNYLKHLISGWGIEPSKITVIPNGVELSAFLVSPKKRFENEILKVIFCGRLVNWKGVETLLLALADTPNIHLSVIGDGPELPMLELLASQLKISERVFFKGKLLGDDYINELSQAHVLVLTSSYEGHSHTLLEASAAGLACIASDVGGNPEIISNGINGLLVPYGDVDALKSALQTLNENEYIRFRLASSAKENASNFLFSKTVELFVSSLEKYI